MSREYVQQQSRVPDLAIGSLRALDSQQFSSSTMCDRELQIEVVELFVAQLASTEQRLISTNLSLDDIKYLSHTLRGAALSIGADEIAYIAARWDELAFDQSEIQVLLQQAEDRFKEAVKNFLRLS